MQHRPLTIKDADALSRLAQSVGWQQTPEDTAGIIGQSGNFIAGILEGSELVGCAAAMVYDPAKLAFINQVIVRPDRQRRGIAQYLVETLMRQLEGCRTLRLYGTEAGMPVYERLGFRAYARLGRWSGSSATLRPRHPDIAPMTPEELPTAIEFDRASFGMERAAMLTRLFNGFRGQAWTARRNGRFNGFVLGRTGTVGTIQCEDPGLALPLLEHALHRPDSHSVTVDWFEASPSIEGFAGLTRLQPMMAMQYGASLPPPPDKYRAALGADVG